MTDQALAPGVLEYVRAFPRYKGFDPAVPVYCLTPARGGYIHRFFDSSPVSDCGRYVGLTRFPFEDRSPRPGDKADVLVLNLDTRTEQVIAQTAAWGSQLGAQVQWGRGRQLFFNDMGQDWKPYGVEADLDTGEKRKLGGTVYHVDAAGERIVSPCLLRTGRTQLGYGVMAPDKLVPRNSGAPADDGVYITDVATGNGRLLGSIRDLVAQVPYLAGDQFSGGDFYVFHTKWSPDGNRIMVIMRWTPAEKRRWWSRSKPASKKTMRKLVLTMAADGSDARIAIRDDLWAQGGHHPNWCPDSRHVLMNLNLDNQGLRYVQADLDGRDVRALHPTAVGSGHPSLHPGGRFLLTDAYPGEPVSYGDGTVPIRLIDLQTGQERVIVRIASRPAYVGDRKEMRLDAHPAWDSSGKAIIFNGCPEGTRQVFLSDVSELVKA